MKTIYYNDGIPEDLFVALCKDLYDPGPIDTQLSASRMNSPTFQIIMENRTRQQMEKDKPIPISWAFNSILGRALHELIEKSFKGHPDYVTEHRVYCDFDVDGKIYTVSGKFDLYKKSTKKISDYKTMMLDQFQFIGGNIYKKEDAVVQVNTIKYLMKHGYILIRKDDKYLKRFLNIDIKYASIFILLNDWSRKKAIQSARVPQIPYHEYEVQTAGYNDIRKMITDKLRDIAKYIDTPTEQIPVCSFEDRWQKETTYPVHKLFKNGNVDPKARAMPGTAGFTSRGQAENFIAGHKDAALLYVAEQKAEATRCKHWCNIGKAGYCPFWNAYKQTVMSSEEDSEV